MSKAKEAQGLSARTKYKLDFRLKFSKRTGLGSLILQENGLLFVSVFVFPHVFVIVFVFSIFIMPSKTFP